MAEPDPLRLYRTFRQVVEDWMVMYQFRFVIPGWEHWPDGVESRQDAHAYYSEQATNQLISLWERRYTETEHPLEADLE